MTLAAETGPAAVHDAVLGIHRAVLEDDSLLAEDNFYDMGGDSILALQVLGRIERELGVAPLAPEERLMMTWEQVRELRRQRHTVGSHTVTHPNLAQVGRDDVTTELQESKRRLEEKLGGPVSHFSYPSPILQPHWSDETVACCGEQGYRTAVTCTPGAVLPTDSLLCLRRISAPERIEDFQWAVECAFVGRYV